MPGQGAVWGDGGPLEGVGFVVIIARGDSLGGGAKTGSIYVVVIRQGGEISRDPWPR